MALEHDVCANDLYMSLQEHVHVCKDVTCILPTYHPVPCGFSCNPRFHHPWNLSPRASGRRRRRLAELHFVRALVPSRVRLRSTNRAASASIPASCSSGSSCAGFWFIHQPNWHFLAPSQRTHLSRFAARFPVDGVRWSCRSISPCLF